MRRFERHDRADEPEPDEPRPSGFGEVLFSGSRFIRRVLAPVIAFAFVALPLMQSEWSPTRAAMVLAIEAALLLLFVALVWPRHAPWAGGIVTLMVFLSYVAFLAEALSTDGDSSLSALLGLVFIGLPSLFLSIRLFRRLGFRREGHYRER